MFKNLKNLIVGILSAVIVIGVGASAYSALADGGLTLPVAAEPSSVAYGNGNGSGSGTANGAGSGTSVLDLPSSELSAEETAALLFMREEEKLARDVYTVLFGLWNQPTFQNIAASEQMHMDEIKTLLDRYAIADPALAPGEFTDPALKALYDQLVAQGSLSLADALKVGAAIEEIDILDLQNRLTQTDNEDIQWVFNNLMSGSYSHLLAFTSTLSQQTGETYQPQYLSLEQFQTILGSAANGNPDAATGQNGSGSSGENGQGNGGQGSATSGTGLPQANISGTSTVHGVVVSVDLTGLSLTLDDGTALYVQLGNSSYNQSIGFAPLAGESVTVLGFPGDQGLFSAISVTLDASGVTYSFRSETGQPLWSGGKGNGRGNGGRP